MIDRFNGVILGKAEFLSAINNLPGRVVKKIMDEWTYKQAQNMARIARASAPRDQDRSKNKPITSRLWRSIRASRVRNLKRFGPSTVSRSIAYSAGRSRGAGRAAFNAKMKRRLRNRRARAPKFGPSAPRARHFHLVVLGTKQRRTRTGANRGSMWGQTPNPMFWQKATAQATAIASGEVGAQLRDAYERGIQAELRRLGRKYK